jgi:hypothetical protein
MGMARRILTEAKKPNQETARILITFDQQSRKKQRFQGYKKWNMNRSSRQGQKREAKCSKHLLSLIVRSDNGRTVETNFPPGGI